MLQGVFLQAEDYSIPFLFLESNIVLLMQCTTRVTCYRSIELLLAKQWLVT